MGKTLRARVQWFARRHPWWYARRWLLGFSFFGVLLIAWIYLGGGRMLEDLFLPEGQYYFVDPKNEGIATNITTTNNGLYAMTIETPRTRSPSVNTIIATFVRQEQRKFRDQATRRIDMLASLHVSYQVLYHDDQYLSLRITSLREIAGSEPHNEVAAWTFDMVSGVPLTIDDLLGGDKIAATARLRVLVAQALQKSSPAEVATIDPAHLTDGDLRNFLVVNRATIAFAFSSGRFAADRFGMHQANVRTSDLKSELTTLFARDLFHPNQVADEDATGKPEPKEPASRQKVDCTVAKCIALTFDDGPSRYTPQLLATLKQYDAHASFFLIGQNVARYPATMKRYIPEGHIVGNHSWSHKNFLRLSKADIRKQIMDNDAAIQKITGVKTRWMRPPYGAYNTEILSVIAETGKPVALWSLDTRDWEARSSDLVYNRVVSGAQRGAVVILHDARLTSVRAVPYILEKLSSEGYSFVTLDDLMADEDVKAGVPYKGPTADATISQ